MPDKDILLLDAVTGKPVCRKEVSTLVDQSSIIGNSDAATPFRVNYSVVAAALAGSGVAANGGKLDVAIPPAVPVATDSVQGKVELTGSAQMPAEKTRDDSALTPAGAAKLLRFIKPVASTGALSAEQTSADGIEVPMFSNFSCIGGTRGAPKFDIPVAGGGTCAIDLGALPYRPDDWSPPSGGGAYAPGSVIFSGETTCASIPETGLYRFKIWADNYASPGEYFYAYKAFIRSQTQIQADMGCARHIILEDNGHGHVGEGTAGQAFGSYAARKLGVVSAGSTLINYSSMSFSSMGYYNNTFTIYEVVKIA